MKSATDTGAIDDLAAFVIGGLTTCPAANAPPISMAVLSRSRPPFRLTSESGRTRPSR